MASARPNPIPKAKTMNPEHHRWISGLSATALRGIARDLSKHRRKLNKNNPVHLWSIDRLDAVEAEIKLQQHQQRPTQ